MLTMFNKAATSRSCHSRDGNREGDITCSGLCAEGHCDRAHLSATLMLLFEAIGVLRASSPQGEGLLRALVAVGFPRVCMSILQHPSNPAGPVATLHACMFGALQRRHTSQRTSRTGITRFHYITSAWVCSVQQIASITLARL